MRSLAQVVIILCLCMVVSSAHAQRSFTPYPIIFVHGLIGSDKTWTDATRGIAHIYGDHVPSRGDDAGTVLHAMLNRYKNVTNVFGNDGIPETSDDDVFVNPAIPLASGLYVVNFETAWNEDPKHPKIIPNTNHWIIARESQSNQSAVVKQGYALKQCIQLVLSATGASKVILVGYSMGGIAIREYMQRRQNGQPRWWIDPASEDGHRVAKVLTISSPHGGSDILKWIPLVAKQGEETPQMLPSIVNTSCEAIRDLRITYASGSQRTGVYLYGGKEAGLNTNWLLSGWHNADVDCNGRENDLVEGINPGLKGAHPLPRNVRYTYAAARVPGFSSDLLVDFDRQYLVADSGAIWPVGVADTIHSSRDHWTVVSDIPTLMRGLDEPGSQADAYEIASGVVYRGAITVQPGGSSRDVDVFRLPVDTVLHRTSSLRLRVRDTLVQGRELSWMLLTASGDTVERLTTGSSRQHAAVVLEAPADVSGGALYLAIAGEARGSEWTYPYEFEFAFEGQTLAAPILQGLVDTTITNVDTLLDAFNVDYDQTPDLLWSVESSDSALIAPSDVTIVGNGSNYTATIVPRPGAVGTVTVRVRCADEALATTVDYDVSLIKDSVNRAAPVILGLRDATIKSSDTLIEEFSVLYDNPDKLRWNIVSLDTTVVHPSNITLLGDGTRLALQVLPQVGSVGYADVQVICSDSVYSVMSGFRITVVNDSLPRTPPVILGMADTTITSRDTLLQNVQVVYEDAEELRWTVTSLDTAVIPATNVTFIAGGTSNVLRVVPSMGVVGTSVIRVVCSDSINTSASEMLVRVTTDTVTNVRSPIEHRAPSLRLHPMPVTQDVVSITLHAPNERVLEVTVADQSGRIMITHPTYEHAMAEQTFTIDTASLPAGRYHLHVRTTRGVHIAPMVILR